ncbi:hypothetical protein [Leifsonia virtsii]|uniref:Lipoprotein n=1 Tax=Leifsonia virtsii TaxID=3035915 RepID=A0ABT8J134_9MICO|nr:hypothetical protein [Leifsonia virtsii]MDN4598588.1 hypothetical protein [Leifsonia virtsii]
MKWVATAAAALTALALAGCAGGGPAASPQPTATVTSTVTATPAPAALSPDDPLDALTAWTVCFAVAQAKAPDAKPYPYDPAHPAEQQPDGTWSVLVGYPVDPPTEGSKSVIVDCELKGTRGAPELVHVTMKDI